MTTASEEWDAEQMRWKIANDHFQNLWLAGLDEDAIEEAHEEVEEIEAALFKTPAPHAEAVLWKIERLFHDEGTGFAPGWPVSFSAPLIEEFRRVLTA